MSAAPRHPVATAYMGLRMRADQFLSLGEMDARMELIDGVITVSPSPVPRHQRVVQELFRQIDRACVEPGHAEIYLDTDVRLADALVYRPDVSVYRAGRLCGDPDCLTEVPDLVIEVLSPSSKPVDLITKREDYERFGVAEYIVIDPDTGCFQRWSRQGPHLVETAVAAGTLESAVFAMLKFDLKRVRAAAGGV